MHVSSLAVYPVKSTAGLDVPEALVHPWGFDRDRRWMVVDAEGTTVTARTHRRLLHVSATPQPDEGIGLSAPGRGTISVAAPCDREPVTLTLSRVDTGLAAADAGEWLSDYLGEPVRLVWLDDACRRTVGVSHGGQPGDTMAFADAGPVLVTSTTSLDRLDEWLGETARDAGEPVPGPLPMVRFRPNIVVDGADEPFAEDGWEQVRVGDVEMRFAERCDRCAFPTIDPVTLTSTKEPTRTLARVRQWDHAVFFGVRMIPLSSGVIRVGDPVSAGRPGGEPHPDADGSP